MDKDKWIENIYNSMRGSQRAQPQSNLFSKIERQIQGAKIKVLPRLVFQYVAVAASLLVIINVTAVISYNEPTNKPTPSTKASEDNTLINSFQIYSE